MMRKIKDKKNLTWRQAFFAARVSPFALLSIIIVVASATYFFATRNVEKGDEISGNNEAGEINRNNYVIKRIKGNKFVQPLLSAKPVNEYPGYSEIKKAAQNVIDGYKNSGIILSASVYARDFDQSNWFAIDDEIKYMPGSLLKIPGMMTILLMEEKYPGILNKSVWFNTKQNHDRNAHIIEKSLPENRIYKLKDLLYYMIVFSDNDATLLLSKQLDGNIFRKLFADLGLRAPAENERYYPMTVKEISLFLETIFNASYMSLSSSEYAINLLTQTKFDEGIVKGIGNQNILVAHKFGEAGTEKNKELHEMAILYVNDRPFLLTIMTRGNNGIDFPKLEEVLRDISKAVYSKLIEIDKKG